jgi:L-cysteine/cystine lyase
LSVAVSGLSALEKRDRLAGLLVARQRGLFPVLEHKTFLNFGAQGPLPAPALAAIDGFYRELDEAGPASLEGSLLAAVELERCRAALASLLDAGAPERLALLDSTSTACNVVLWGLDWRRGDQILMGDHEYPPVAAAVREVARRHGLEVGLVPSSLGPDRLLSALTSRLSPRTRLVVLSHVTWDTGHVLPLAAAAAVCRERGKGRTRVLVDGAQAAGAMPLALTALGADFYALPGHKWCCGPEGTGALYVGAGALDELHPTFIGPRGLREERPGGGDANGGRDDGGGPGGRLVPQAGARRFEISTCAALYAGWRAALATHDGWGSPESRWQRIRRLARRLWEALRELEPAVTCLQAAPPEAGLVFFRCGADGDRGAGRHHERLARLLEARGVLVRSMPGAGSIRASVHYLTLESDLDRLCAEVSALAERQPWKASGN